MILANGRSLRIINALGLESVDASWILRSLCQSERPTCVDEIRIT